MHVLATCMRDGDFLAQNTRNKIKSWENLYRIGKQLLQQKLATALKVCNKPSAWTVGCLFLCPQVYVFFPHLCCQCLQWHNAEDSSVQTGILGAAESHLYALLKEKRHTNVHMPLLRICSSMHTCFKVLSIQEIGCLNKCTLSHILTGKIKGAIIIYHQGL